jgi:hypothetical protein
MLSPATLWPCQGALLYYPSLAFYENIKFKNMSIPTKTSLISMIQNDALLTIIDPNSTSNAANDPIKNCPQLLYGHVRVPFFMTINWHFIKILSLKKLHMVIQKGTLTCPESSWEFFLLEHWKHWKYY